MNMNMNMNIDINNIVNIICNSRL